MKSNITHYASLVLVYRRVLYVWGLAPLLTLTVPRLAQGTWLLLSLLSEGQAFMAIVTYIALAAAGYMTIVALQPKHLDAVWRRNRDKYALPLVAVSLAVARSMPAFWKLDCSFGTVLLSVRVATALALLGVAVVSRYVGPHSMSK